MMDRNREARRAAAMANGLQRRRHRTSTNPGSLRDSPEEDGPLELQETARLRDRTVKKDRDREMRDRVHVHERDRDRDRDRDLERERERERLSRSKRRRGDKYMHGGSIREDGLNNGGGGGLDDSSEESVNDEEDDDEDGPVRYAPPPNQVPMSTSSPASSLTHRKSFPPPNKVYRVAPTWKAPDEMIGFSVPRKARSASVKRSHDYASGGGVSGEQMNRQASSSPVRSAMTSAVTATPAAVPSASPARPMSPSSSNISIKKKIANGPKPHRPPKSASSTKSSPSIQDEIEIEVAEVLYGLMRQSQAPSSSSKQELPPPLSNDSASRSNVSSPIPNSNSPSIPPAPPLTTVAPKRKRPRPYPEELPGGLGPRISPIQKLEPDQAPKPEATSVSEKQEGSAMENGGRELVQGSSEPAPVSISGVSILPDNISSKVVEESGACGRNGMLMRTAKAEEASSSSPKLESSPRHDRVESSSTSNKPNSAEVRKEQKFEIDLMAPPSPEKEEEMVEYGRGGRDEKCMVTDKEAEAKSKPNEEGDTKVVELNRAVADETKAAASTVVAKSEPHRSTSLSSPKQQINLNGRERHQHHIDLQLDLEKGNSISSSVNDSKLSLGQQVQKQQLQQPPKINRDDSHSDKPGGQSSSVPMQMSVPAGWHGGLAPMGYVGPLQGVVSMDGTTMASPPIQPPHFLFSQPRPKRCATHCYVARSISVHQQMSRMNPYWPAAAAAAAAAGTSPLFGAKPYNLNMIPSAELNAGRGGAVNPAQENKGQPFAFFPGQPLGSTKDSKSSQAPNVPDSAQKKQFLLQPALPPGAPANMMHPQALFFPMNQQQVAASARPSTGKSQPGGSAASTSTTTSAPMGVATTGAPAGPAMSFSYPNMGGNETQFMAILGNGAYPFPIPAHVGAAAQPYRGSHPQALSFFNGSFYSSQMLHPSQLQQQQPGQPSQSMQIQQQNHQNAAISSTSSSSQKHMQSQQQRPQGTGSNAAGNLKQSPSLQNFQGAKGRDMGSEDSPSSADSRNRPNLSVYGQNFAMPFPPNFAFMPSSLPGSNVPGVPNGNHGDKKQQQQHQQSQQQALNSAPYPMSFTTINGATSSPLDISTMAHNHAMLQSLPESARHNYQMMAAAAAAQVAQQKNNNYRGPEDGKSGAGAATDSSNLDEERKAIGARVSAASVGQSIAFSRELAENTVVDSSARSLNLVPGSSRPARPSSGPNSGGPNSQQQQSQMLFSKQQQYAASVAANARSKTPSTSNGNAYPDHLTPSVLGAKFPNSLSGFPSLMQTSGSHTQPPQWKNSVRPNTSQMSSPTISSPSNMKNIHQQQGRPQQSHTQISFGAAVGNSKPSTMSQGQQMQSSSRAPSPPMMVGSPSNSSMSKSAGGSPRTTASASGGNKSAAQASSLSSQQGKNSPSSSLSSQKPSILGSPHVMSAPGSGNKPQMQQSQQLPQLSKQSLQQNIQQTQLYFSNPYMQASANSSAAMAGTGYYLQRHRPDNQQQQQQGSKSQGSAPPTSSGGMLSLCTPVSLGNSGTADPAKVVAAAAAAAAASNVKGSPQSQGIFNAAHFAQAAGGTHQLMSASYPYVHAVSSAVQVKPVEQKQPAGE